MSTDDWEFESCHSQSTRLKIVVVVIQQAVGYLTYENCFEPLETMPN